MAAARHAGPGRGRLMLAACLVLVPASRATWQDDIGYTRLKAELGPALPLGEGVAVTLVEASLTSAGGEYLPSAEVAPAAGNFAGKEFVFQSGLAPVSSHAVRVASFFFGANTNPLAGDASVAPLAGGAPAALVDCFEADGWLGSDFLGLGGMALPRTGTGAVANHSWIGAIGDDFTAGQANEALRRLDWSVAAGGRVEVAGLNNGAGTSVPPLLGSAYNVVSVGRTDGQHSTGTSSAAVDGAGRAKPELVAPMTATSWSTAVVSSCVALLEEAAALISPDAGRSEVVRALLLAGARKDPFPAWTNTATRPLDPHFGAGEVNIWRSYRVLAAGSFPDSWSTAAGVSGWHLGASLAPADERRFTFFVPEGCVAREFSAALVWNRAITTSAPGAWVNPAPVLANLDLKLHASTGFVPGTELARSESGAGGSVPHPLEHVYVRGLAAGGHTLRVVNPASGAAAAGFGLAWFSSLAPAADPVVVSQRSGGGPAVTLSFAQLGTGLTYALETSLDLQNWSMAQTLTPASTTAAVTVDGTGERAFYRLSWVP